MLAIRHGYQERRDPGRASQSGRSEAVRGSVLLVAAVDSHGNFLGAQLSIA